MNYLIFKALVAAIIYFTGVDVLHYIRIPTEFEYTIITVTLCEFVLSIYVLTFIFKDYKHILTRASNG